jgi:glycosyltransferase involved in cell wall biosynthesis
MNEEEKTVCLLFRKPDRFFSIERIFQQLEPRLIKHIPVTTWTAPSGFASPLSIAKNLLAARKVRASIFHVTGDIHYIVLALPRRKTILTIHDCIFLYQTTGIKRLVIKWLFLKLPVMYCRMVITISEASKRDIVRNTGCRPEKIVVIPDPVDDTIHYAPLSFRTTNPVILFIGSTKHKNLERVIPALLGISCRLHIIGKLPQDSVDLLQKNNIQYIQQYKLSNEEIALKYSSADLVLFPSTFEGFGLPILEGQKAGRPVITSDLSPMKDVAGNAACLVDPYNIESIREGILKVIGDEEYRKQLIAAGFENIKRFTAESVADQYYNCYEKILSA